MKKSLYSFLLILFALSAQASHITGGSLHWYCQGNGQYVFEVILYRHCDGIATPSTLNVTAHNHPSVSSIPLTKVASYDVSPDCTAGPGQIAFSCGSMGGGQGNGIGAIEKAVYQSAPVSLPGVPPATGWIFTHTQCCRNSSIDNLIGAASSGSTLVAMMFPNSGSVAGQCTDNSPVYLGDDNVLFCENESVVISTLPTDTDADSLYTSWSHPYDFFGQGGWNPPANPGNVTYASGYSMSAPLPVIPGSNTGAVLNHATGQISYSSVTAGEFVMCVETESWRNGELMAKVRKDWTASILSCGAGNNPPMTTFSLVSQPLQIDTAGINHYRLWIEPNAPFQFDYLASDSDINPGTATPQVVALEARGALLGTNWMDSTSCANPPCATIVPAGGQSAYANVMNNQVSFRWNPGVHHLSNPFTNDPIESPYSFELLMVDDYCSVPARDQLLMEIFVVLVPPMAPLMVNIQLDANLDAMIQWSAPSDTGSGLNGMFVYHNTDANQPNTFTPIDTLQWGVSPHRVPANRLRPGGHLYVASMGLDGESVSSDTLQIPILTPDVADLTSAALNGNGQVELQWTPPTNSGSGIGGILLKHNNDPAAPQNFVLVDSISTSTSLITVDATGLNLSGAFFLETYDILNQLVGTSATVTLSSIGLSDDRAINGVKIYPIPASDIIQVEFPKGWMSPQFAMTDLQGKVVKEGSLENGEINCSALARGAYMLRIAHDQQVIEKKVLLY